jgi:hypothetical protein
MYSEVVDQIKIDLGYEVVYDIASHDVIQTRVIATEGKGWDVTLGSYHALPIIQSGYVKPIPVAEIPRFKPGHLMKIFEEPEKILDDVGVAQINEYHWVPGQEGTMAWQCPVCSNYDSYGYNPEFIPYEEKGGQEKLFSFAEILKDEYFGYASLENSPVDVWGHQGNWMYRTGQWTPEMTHNDATQAEYELMMDLLLPYVKSGHFVNFWVEYGECVNILAMREAYFTNTWQPAVMDCRRAGTPMYYTALEYGTMYWTSGDMPSVATDLPDKALYSYINWRLSPWWTRFIGRNGYTVSTYLWEDTRQFMKPEYFDWHYMGQQTSTPYDEWMAALWPDKTDLPRRIGNAIFLPDVYMDAVGWRSDPSPHPDGNWRDQGSVEMRNENIGWYQYWPKYGDAMTETWVKMIAQRPA